MSMFTIKSVFPAIVGAVVGIGISASVGSAAPLGGYDFGTSSTGGLSVSPTGVASGLSFSPFSSSSGLTNVNGVSGNPSAGGNRAISAQNWSTAFDSTKYFTFGITPSSTTSSFSISSLKFDARGGGNAPNSIQIRSSLDNYGNSIGTFANSVGNDWSTLGTCQELESQR